MKRKWFTDYAFLQSFIIYQTFYKSQNNNMKINTLMTI
ncbi:hypothetical protein B4083_2983 [Bacillus cereus]|nr:hypothetical protein B4083_2983 [Bacillus cereus]